jgi:hypothetical protein
MLIFVILLWGRQSPIEFHGQCGRLLLFIGTGAAWSSNADIWATVRIFMAGFVPLLVVLSSFANRNSYWKMTTFDFLCGILSFIALFFWAVADSPRTAIVLAASGDGLAALPTVIKAWRYPETETGFTYLASFISVVLVIPSIPEWNIENSAFQIYLLLVNTLLLAAVYRKKWSLQRRRF